MIRIFKCRRSFLALIGMIILGYGLHKGIDTSAAIAGICVGIAGANAYQKRGKPDPEDQNLT